jgi:hypothetical protein
MIHHISIDARDPLRVAGVLAEIWKGKVYKFLIPGSYLVMPFDNYGSHIVVFKSGDVWVPGADVEAAKVSQTTPTDFVSAHVSLCRSTINRSNRSVIGRAGESSRANREMASPSVQSSFGSRIASCLSFSHQNSCPNIYRLCSQNRLSKS